MAPSRKSITGQLIPARRFGLQSAQKLKGVVEWVKRTPQIGEPERALINTSHAERLNLTVRIFNRRFTRCTLGYSKKLRNHVTIQVSGASVKR